MAVKRNDDFSYVAVTTTNTGPDINESFGVIAFYLYGGMYAAFAAGTINVAMNSI